MATTYMGQQRDEVMPAIDSLGRLHGNNGILFTFDTSADLITFSSVTGTSVVLCSAALLLELVTETMPMACRVPKPSSEQTL